MENKLSLSVKIAYATASVGDAAIYCLVNTYCMFFLTTVVGIEPAIAGFIVALGSIWNAIWNPIIGYLSDRARSNYGRRRIFISFSLPFIILFYTMMFTKVPFSDGVRTIYYCIIIILLWTFYSTFFVPYSTLATQYSNDYNDRAILRLFASGGNYIGVVIGLAMPPLFADSLQKLGLSESLSWTVLAFGITLFSAILIFYTTLKSKPYDPPCGKKSANYVPPEKGSGIVGIFKEYVDIVKLPPMKWLVLMTVAGLICYSFSMTDIAYYLKYCAHFDSTQISYTMLLRPAYGFFILFFGTKLILKFDKANAFAILSGLGMLCFIYTRIAGNTNLSTILIYMLGFSLAAGNYWIVPCTVYYDMCEYDKLVSGKDRAGAIVSFQGFGEAVACGIGAQMLGIILQIAGFDGNSEVQSEKAMEWIVNSATIIPCIFILIAVFALYKYPINRERYNKMIETKGESERCRI